MRIIIYLYLDIKIFYFAVSYKNTEPGNVFFVTFMKIYKGWEVLNIFKNV